jgi:hypothetical protein
VIADVWVVLGTLAFFAVCVALVWGCDRMIGPDDASDLADDDAAPMPDDVAAEPAGAAR